LSSEKEETILVITATSPGNFLDFATIVSGFEQF